MDIDSLCSHTLTIANTRMDCMFNFGPSKHVESDFTTKFSHAYIYKYMDTTYSQFNNFNHFTRQMMNAQHTI